MPVRNTIPRSKNVKFKGCGRDEFLCAVRLKASDYFKKNDISPHADAPTHIKNTLIISIAATTYFCIILELGGPFTTLLLAMFFGVMSGAIPMNLCHDCLHGSYSKNPKINRLLGCFWDVIGPSSFVWKRTHNGAHHTYTNIAGHDPDIEKPGLLRLAPSQPHYWVHRWQHLYIWFLYSLVSVNWICVADYQYLAKEWKFLSSGELANFIFFKLVNIIVFLVVPLYMLSFPFWQILIGFMAYHMMGGFSVALIFQLAHLVENVEFPLPGEGDVLESAWSEHEMRTTANFGTTNRWLTFFLGGLNFQVEHHLFPHVSHCHYKNLALIVKETARDFGLPYHENPSLWAAVKSHYRTLRKLGNHSLKWVYSGARSPT